MLYFGHCYLTENIEKDEDFGFHKKKKSLKQHVIIL